MGQAGGWVGWVWRVGWKSRRPSALESSGCSEPVEGQACLAAGADSSRPSPPQTRGAKAVALLDRADRRQRRTREAARAEEHRRHQTDAVTSQRSGRLDDVRDHQLHSVPGSSAHPDVAGGNTNSRRPMAAEAWVKDRARRARRSPRRWRGKCVASLRRDIVALLLAAKSGTLTPRLLPDVKDRVWPGRSRARAVGARPQSGRAVRRSRDRPDRQAHVRRRRAGTRPLVEEQFSDYRRSTASRSRSARSAEDRHA